MGVWGGAVSSNAGVRTEYRVRNTEYRETRMREVERGRKEKRRRRTGNGSERSSTAVVSIWSRPSNNSLL